MGWFSEKRGDSRGLSHLGWSFWTRAGLGQVRSLSPVANSREQATNLDVLQKPAYNHPIGWKWDGFDDAKG
jgi:hypothetical protein